MLVHASATLHWLQNWTMNCKIALGAEKYVKKKKKKNLSVCVGSNMYYSSRSQIAGEIRRLVLFTNLCQFVKLDKSMSTRWLLLWRLEWLWQEFGLNEWLTQAEWDAWILWSRLRWTFWFVFGVFSFTFSSFGAFGVFADERRWRFELLWMRNGNERREGGTSFGRSCP